MRFRRRELLVGLVLTGWMLSGCSTGEPTESASASERPAENPSARPRIVVLGDSLTAGYGLPRDQAFPALLQQRLEAEGWDYEVSNAGVSGDTSAGGLRRLDWALEGDVRVLIVALGGNDGLRGLPVSEMKNNLAAIIEGARQRKITVVLAGMEAPPNQGDAYASAFRNAFRELADEYDIVFFPFLLRDVAGNPELNQADGIHPNREGARIIAENLCKVLDPVLESPSNP